MISVFALILGVFGLSAAANAEVPASPTFTKDIAPIFQEKCEACHRPESIAPMALRTYEEARPWARAIKNRIETRQMPPWHIDKTVGIQKFKNDRSLNDDQIATIVKWVDQGAVRGDEKDMPPAKVWKDDLGWVYAPLFGQKEPDLILRTPPFTMKAGANDTWFNPIVPTGLTEPRWVRAVETRPATVKGRKITHHANADLYQIDPSAPDIEVGAGHFSEFAVGKEGDLMRADSGKLLTPGSKFSIVVHYSNGGEDITDYVEMGIYFYPKGEVPRYRQYLTRVGKTGVGALDIPPNTVQVSEAFFALRQNTRLESIQPHMHLRGKAMTLEAILPNGQNIVLNHVNNYNFNWHTSYIYADDAAPLLPKGTILKSTAWHDNTAALKSNPDPNVWVGYGDRTVDEMAHNWINVTYLTDEEYAAEVEARKAALGRPTQQQ